jgi:hypothetical protein
MEADGRSDGQGTNFWFPYKQRSFGPAEWLLVPFKELDV